MTDLSPRFGLPLLVAGQAQKEEGHNEAIVALEALAQAVAETLGDAAPPAAPVAGTSWIVGPTPTGAWSGQGGALATWTAGGWRFLPPAEGMAAYVRASRTTARYQDGRWTAGEVRATAVLIDGLRVLGPRQRAVPNPAAGATVDTEARAAVDAILAALRAHGLIEA